MTREYEVVGVVNAEVAAEVVATNGTIVVEHDDPSERLLARPKSEGADA